MSQSEVERLLALVGDSDASGTEINPSGSETQAGQTLLARHDFPQVSSFSAEEMRKLRLRCESFICTLAARLSVHLNLECVVQMSKLETVRFEQFVNTLANPTHLTLFRLDPLRGICLLDIPPRLALTIVDRELGGPAAATDEVRDLTQIEAKLAGKVLAVLLGEWCATWADTLPLRPVQIRCETSGRHLQTSPAEAMMLTLGMETRVAQTIEQIQMAIPQSVLEPLLLKLNSDLKQVEKPEAAQPRTPIKWNAAMNDVPIQLSAHWQGMELTARQILDLKPGDVLPLRPATTSQVQISLDSTPKFSGQLGTSGRQLAIQIVGVL
jgi:flagellar motor switch protein FliM